MADEKEKGKEEDEPVKAEAKINIVTEESDGDGCTLAMPEQQAGGKPSRKRWHQRCFASL